MRAIVQRVKSASVTVGSEIYGAIEQGLLVLVGTTDGDGPADVRALANKLVALRIFADESGKMNRSVVDIGGAVLVVSQFTVYGSVRRGHRPSFDLAGDPCVAEHLIDELANHISQAGVPIATGRFGAMMDVRLVNDGPVTIVVESLDGRIQ